MSKNKNQAENKSTISAIKIMLEDMYKFFSCSSAEKVLFTVAESHIMFAPPLEIEKFSPIPSAPPLESVISPPPSYSDMLLDEILTTRPEDLLTFLEAIRQDLYVRQQDSRAASEPEVPDMMNDEVLDVIIKTVGNPQDGWSDNSVPAEIATVVDIAGDLCAAEPC